MQLDYFKIININSGKFIDQKNNGEINIEEYIKTGFVKNYQQFAWHLKEKGYDLKEYLGLVNNIRETMSPTTREDSLKGTIGALVLRGMELKQSNRKTRNTPEVYDFKDSCMMEIIYEDQDLYLNTSKDQEGYSWENMLADIEEYEYYTTDTGRFLVNSKDGTILGVCDNGEIINIEENNDLLHTGENEKNPNAIKYTYDDKESEIFITEKDENGKYKLKGFIQDENGKYIPLDVGLGRDFFDDTTQLDRQIAVETSEVKSNSIKKVVETIKSDINKDRESQNENIEMEEKQENGER